MQFHVIVTDGATAARTGELVTTRGETPMSEVMSSPVVSAEEDDVQDDIEEMFAKYHYRMIPVVDAQDRILGVIYYNDVMKGSEHR